MTEHENKLNAFLVQVFGDILRLEEASLRTYASNLSLSELHVLEAVDNCQKAGSAIMAQVAKTLYITAGTLTASVKTLEQKGYLVRNKVPGDKRKVTLALTGAAIPVLAHHTRFHNEMVRQAMQELSSEEVEVLAKALSGLHTHFSTLKTTERQKND